jgi:formyl-CoA transferase
MGAYGAAIALFARERTGEGDCVDVALFEPLMRLIDWQVIVYDQLGIVPTRAGGAFPLPLEGVAAGVTQTSDGVWMSFSSATDTVLVRLIKLIFGEEAIEEPRFADRDSRRRNVGSVQEAVATWIEQRTAAEVEEEFARADAVVCRILDMEGIWRDQAVRERDDIIEVEDEILGPIAMHGIVPKMSRRPGRVKHSGPTLGSSTDDVLSELGRSESEISDLRAAGTI